MANDPSIEEMSRRISNQGIRPSELPFRPVFSDIVCPSARGCTADAPAGVSYRNV